MAIIGIQLIILALVYFFKVQKKTQKKMVNWFAVFPLDKTMSRLKKIGFINLVAIYGMTVLGVFMIVFDPIFMNI